MKKTVWYMIAWIRTDTGESKLVTIEEAPGEINLTSGRGEATTKITRYECNEAMRTLGARLAPSGTMDKELVYRKEQCHNWAQAMKESKLTKRDAYKAYHNVLIPKVCYPFATTTMTEKELKGLQVIADKVYLPRAGLNRHFPLAILYGPS